MRALHTTPFWILLAVCIAPGAALGQVRDPRPRVLLQIALLEAPLSPDPRGPWFPRGFTIGDAWLPSVGAGAEEARRVLLVEDDPHILARRLVPQVGETVTLHVGSPVNPVFPDLAPPEIGGPSVPPCTTPDTGERSLWVAVAPHHDDSSEVRLDVFAYAGRSDPRSPGVLACAWQRTTALVATRDAEAVAILLFDRGERSLVLVVRPHLLEDDRAYRRVFTRLQTEHIFESDRRAILSGQEGSRHVDRKARGLLHQMRGQSRL